MEKLLIIRLSSLGDIIHTLPAYSALRKNWPEAKISWIVEERGKEILDFVPGIDKIITVHTEKKKKVLKSTWDEVRRIKKELKDRSQIALDFQGLIKSGFFAFLSRARRRIGFHKKNLREPLASVFYTEKLEEIPETIHVIDKNLRLLTMIGTEENKYEFSLNLPDELRQAVNTKLQKLGYDSQRRLIILNVGAAWPTKRWFPERWVELIDKIRQEDFFLLLLWGNEEEKALAMEINAKTHIPLSPPLSLKEVMALVPEATLLISGDTFALQVACALSRPVVGIFGPTNPRRNGPFSAQDRVAFHEMECSYCYKRACPSVECLKKISVEEVVALSRQVLEKNA